MFTPDKMVPVSNMTLAVLLHHLDTEFQRKVDDGWVNDYFENKIYLNLSPVDELGKALATHRTEVEKHYKSIGWKRAIVVTSSEQGERPGLISINLISITLFKSSDDPLEKETLDTTNKFFLQDFLTAVCVHYTSSDPLYDETTTLEELETELLDVRKNTVWPFNYANVARFLSKHQAKLKTSDAEEAIYALINLYEVLPDEAETTDEDMARMFLSKIETSTARIFSRTLDTYDAKTLGKLIEDCYAEMNVAGVIPFNRQNLVEVLYKHIEMHFTFSDEVVVQTYIDFLISKINS